MVSVCPGQRASATGGKGFRQGLRGRRPGGIRLEPQGEGAGRRGFRHWERMAATFLAEFTGPEITDGVRGARESGSSEDRLKLDARWDDLFFPSP